MPKVEDFIDGEESKIELDTSSQDSHRRPWTEGDVSKTKRLLHVWQNPEVLADLPVLPEKAKTLAVVGLSQVRKVEQRFLNDQVRERVFKTIERFLG